MAASPARLAANAAYHQKRIDAGMKKVTVWLDAPTLAALAALAEIHGSKDASITKGIWAITENPVLMPAPRECSRCHAVVIVTPCPECGAES